MLSFGLGGTGQRRIDRRRQFGAAAVTMGELVAHLASGAGTREVGQRTFLSENTIQGHLESIVAKTGTRNRRTLLARAVGR